MVNGEDLLERERLSQLSGHLTPQGPRCLFIIFNFILKFTHHQIIAFIINAWIPVMYFDEICLYIKYLCCSGFLESTWPPPTPSALDLTQLTLDCHRYLFFYLHAKCILWFFLLVFNILGHFFSFELNLCQVRIMHLPCPSELHLTAWAEFEKMKEEECVHISEKLIFRSFRCNFWQELKEQ